LNFIPWNVTLNSGVHNYLYNISMMSEIKIDDPDESAKKIT